MVSFELGKEVEKYFSSCHETGTKKKFWVPMRFDSSWGLRIFSLSQACDKTKNIVLHATCCYQKLRDNPKHAN